MALTRQQIFDADDRPLETVPVPEWGGEVMIRTLGGADRDLLEMSVVNGNTVNIRARVAAMAICDENGRSLFTEHDIVILGKKSGVALERVFSACQALSHLVAEDIEELAGNSDAAPSGDSGSS